VTLCLVLSSVLTACDSSETPGDSPGGLGRVGVAGRALDENGKALASQALQAQVHLVVDGPVGALGPGCPAETQHRASPTILTGADGSYSLALSAADFAPVSHSACPLSNAGRLTIRALRVAATTGNSAPGASAQLRANSRADSIGVSRLVRDDAGWKATLNLVFDEATLPLAEASGLADLQVDGSVAASSWSIEERVFEEGSCALHEQCVTAPGRRKLLTFDGAILNASASPLVIGDPSARPDAQFDDCHQHEHLGGVMDYELRSMAGVPVTRGRKQGFCLMDTARATGDSPGRFTCEYQGISPGWSDVYDRSLDCQWVDVTDVPAGDYVLRLTANPEFVFEESDYSNNSVDVPVTVR
jgi:hypothetical protein